MPKLTGYDVEVGRNMGGQPWPLDELEHAREGASAAVLLLSCMCSMGAQPADWCTPSLLLLRAVAAWSSANWLTPHLDSIVCPSRAAGKFNYTCTATMFPGSCVIIGTAQASACGDGRTA